MRQTGLTRVEGIVLIVVGGLLVILAGGAGLWWHLSSDEDDGASGYDAPGGVLTLRGKAQRTACRAHLRGLGMAMQMYASANYRRFPTLGSTLPVEQTRAEPTAADSLDRFYRDNQDCVAQAYWLLVERGFVSDGQFKCAADGVYTPPKRDMDYGFDSWLNVSYGLQPTTSKWKARPSHFLDGDLVIMADGPRRRNLRVGSAHHGAAGGNYLKLDGSVPWTDGGNDVGVEGDWIFEPNDEDDTDSYLLWGKVNAPDNTSQ